MIFVDSGAWFASVVEDDIDHAAAARWLAENNDQLITTDFVADETLTLLRARGEYRRAIEMGTIFFESKEVVIHFLSEQDIRDTWKIFSLFADKDWSFTDCSSRLICERFGIRQAFAFDRHFKQFGTVSVVP